MSGIPWTKEHEEKLEELRKQGLQYKEIGEILDRTPSSVACKARNLGLSKKYTSNKNTYTDGEFIKACENNISIRQVLLTLGLKPAGANYTGFYNTLKRLNIDTTHFKGIASNHGENHKGGSKARPLEVYLNNQYPIHSYRLKNRLVNENLLEYKCILCNINSWLENDLTLELDHIDGNNNNLSNLRLLCPNCHSQTSTFRGKNIKNNS